MTAQRVPVLIVGGAYTGLSTALSLASRGVRPLLIERRSSTSNLPKAWGLNARTQELLHTLPGVRPRLEAATKDLQWPRMSIGNSLADPRRKFLDPPANDSNDPDTLSPAPPLAWISQAQVEEILRGCAEQQGADLRFRTELVSFTQNAGDVTATLRELETGREYQVTADYLVAADGVHSGIRDSLRIGVEGRGTLGYMYIITFTADLSSYIEPGAVEVVGIAGAGSSFILDGTDRHTLWVDYLPDQGQSPEDFTEELCLERIRAAIGDPTVDPKFVNARFFPINHKRAKQFRSGRVFLAGDSAHSCPPNGGQGGNLAIQDAYDLSWRLALVLGDQAGPELLSMYETERRPVIDITLEREVKLASVSEGRIPASYNPSDPDAPIPTPREFLGFRYNSAAISIEPDDDGAVQEDPWTATGRPGGRAPHVVLADGERVLSTYDLFGVDFVLIAGNHGEGWVRAAHEVTRKLGVPMRAYRMGDRLTDVDAGWCARYGVTSSGAALIRPDAVVAWRRRRAVADHEWELTTALTRALARDLPAAAC